MLGAALDIAQVVWFPPVLAFMREQCVGLAYVEACAFGAPRKKPTGLAANFGQILWRPHGLSAPRERRNRSPATPEIFMYRVGPEGDKHKKVARVTFLSDIKKPKKKKSHNKRVMEIIKKVISEQANKKSDKKHEKVFV